MRGKRHSPALRIWWWFYDFEFYIIRGENHSKVNCTMILSLYLPYKKKRWLGILLRRLTFFKVKKRVLLRFYHHSEIPSKLSRNLGNTRHLECVWQNLLKILQLLVSQESYQTADKVSKHSKVYKFISFAFFVKLCQPGSGFSI